jgi:GH25 family lysozyme M1 (1,4-beta-N-acetylmuramidase)
MSIQSIIRYFQGERAGMGSQFVMPDHYGEQLAAVSLSPTIVVSQDVLLADVSYYQREIDFQLMKAAGIQGVIIRAGQRNWVDSQFKVNWSKAKIAGLPRGSYWLYDSREDPKKQAALWWSLVRDDPGELVHVADLEENYGGPYGNPEHFKIFINEFQRLSGLPDARLAIYSGYFWWQARVGADLFFKRFDLWLAWYAEQGIVRVPAPWSDADLLFWQFTSSGPGPRYGVSSQEIDLNWYCCSTVHYINRFNLTEIPPEETMEKVIKGVAVGNVTRRKSPAGESFVPARYLMTGDTIEASENINQWLHLSKINGEPVTDTEWASAGASQQYIKWSWVDVPTDPPAPPVTTLPDLPYTITLGDNITYTEVTITGVLKPK